MLRGQQTVHLGMFPTVEEAALRVARTPEAQAQVADPAGEEPHVTVVDGLAFVSGLSRRTVQ